jgi:hypothetical protein
MRSRLLQNSMRRTAMSVLPRVVLCGFALLVLSSCARVQVDPIEVKPIHITMDINIKVDRQLDDFFAFEDKYRPTTQPASTTATTQASAR